MMKNKNILFILFSLEGGGTQRMMVNVLNQIPLREGKKILYLYNYSPNPVLEEQLDKTVSVFKCNTKNQFKHIRRLILLLRIIKKEKITGIVSFAATGTYLAILANLFLPRRVPIVYRMVSVASAINHSTNSIQKKVNTFLYRNVLCPHVDKIIAQSNYMADNMTREMDERIKNKTVTIFNFMNSERIIKMCCDEIELNFKYFIYVGRFSKEKNVLGILESYRKISETIDEKLILIGQGSQKEEIKKYIDENCLMDRVIIFEYQNNPYKYIARATALILFSEFEGMSNVVLETMLCKTPVIVSDYQGVEDIVENDRDGFIVRKGNIQELAAVIGRVASDQKLRERISECAYNTVINLNSTAQNRYCEIINEQK